MPPLHTIHTSLTSLGTYLPLSPALRPPAFECMALTSAVANAAAAAAAAGAGKKNAQVQLQAELNTDDEWSKFLTRDGLLGKFHWVYSKYLYQILT